jgi:hypothetical protein
MASARRSTEQRILDAGLSRSGPPEIGARTEWLIGALSRLAKSRGIILKTRQGLTTFGEGLADDEIQYLCAVVRQALVR